MKLPITIGFMLLALVPLAPAQAAGEQSCNVTVDVVDPDPKGTNVRAAPGGAVLAALKNPGEGWIEVHIAAQSGDWYEIDRASLIETDPAGKIIFQGKGYVHKSMLGVSGMRNGGAIYSDHDSGSAPLVLHAAGDQPVQLLGCWGEFLKVHVKAGNGWTREACTNMNTTCV
ncbi:MAG: hypothetical protein P4L83_09900 [Nevskia sp.]|nr:hypothetical protein [Nevskia sp.]